MKAKFTTLFLPLFLMLPQAAYAQSMMRGRGYGGYNYPVPTGMMNWRYNGLFGPWTWIYAFYHTAIGLLIFIILVLIAVLLWKKINWMDEKREMHEEYTNKESRRKEKE